MISKPINLTLPASGQPATVVSLGANQNIKDYAIQARGSVEIKISDVSAMTTYWTIKADRFDALSQLLPGGTDLFYAVSGSDADVIEILPLAKLH